MNSPIWILGLGFAAPGLDGWAEAAAVLRGETVYQRRELTPSAPQLLPANERRRAGAAVSLAFRVAEEAVGQSGIAAAELSSVFASSDADTHIIHRICGGLAEPQRIMSPTDFHNSVHNAAAGYWAIATGCRRSSTSLSAWDATFAAGLLEAGALVQTENRAVLLVVYDIRPLPPLAAARGIRESAALALVLSPQVQSSAPAQLELSCANANDRENVCNSPELEALRRSNPALRALPLLNLLARRSPGVVCIATASGGGLQIRLCP